MEIVYFKSILGWEDSESFALHQCLFSMFLPFSRSDQMFFHLSYDSHIAT